jgi:hypothetical protein
MLGHSRDAAAWAGYRRIHCMTIALWFHTLLPCLLEDPTGLKIYQGQKVAAALFSQRVSVSFPQ